MNDQGGHNLALVTSGIYMPSYYPPSDQILSFHTVIHASYANSLAIPTVDARPEGNLNKYASHCTN